MPKIIDNRNGTVTIRYEPTEVGLHQMRVTYNDSPVDGSPFEFSVEAVRAGNVTAHGSGLVQGVAGTKCSFVINTANLGTSKFRDFLFWNQNVCCVALKLSTGHLLIKKPCHPHHTHTPLCTTITTTHTTLTSLHTILTTICTTITTTPTTFVYSSV